MLKQAYIGINAAFLILKDKKKCASFEKFQSLGSCVQGEGASKSEPRSLS